MRDSVIVIGGWDNEDSDSIRLQDFIIDGESVIPIFADGAAFLVCPIGKGVPGGLARLLDEE